MPFFQEQPNLMDIIANCLMDIDDSFQGWQKDQLNKQQPQSSEKPQGKKQCATANSTSCTQSPANRCPKKSTDLTHFHATFDLESFEPSEISVNLEGSTLVVRGKHELKSEDDGRYESREYIKKVTILDNVLSDQMRCVLDQRGQLQIVAPFKKPQVTQLIGRDIPVQFVKSTPPATDAEQSMPIDDSEKQQQPAQEKSQEESTSQSEMEVAVEDVGPD